MTPWRALHDPRGAWPCDPAHTEAKSEYALSFDDKGRAVTVIMDRSFVDSHGVRWIIYFKTSTHSGGGQEVFPYVRRIPP